MRFYINWRWPIDEARWDQSRASLCSHARADSGLRSSVISGLANSKRHSFTVSRKGAAKAMSSRPFDQIGPGLDFGCRDTAADVAPERGSNMLACKQHGRFSLGQIPGKRGQLAREGHCGAVQTQ